VWIPLHLTEQRSAQLGRLLKIEYLLERDRLEDYAAELSADLRMRLLDSVRALVGHELVGERAARLVTGVAEAARDDQYTRDLIPVLGDVRSRAVALGSEAARLAAVPAPFRCRSLTPSPCRSRNRQHRR